MQEVIVDLRGVRGTGGILKAFGRDLYFGGPDQKQFLSSSKEEGWGHNWNAMNDCLVMLDSGGLWGTSPKFKFPLRLILLHNGTMWREPQKVMVEILDDAAKAYAKDSMKLSYELREDNESYSGRPLGYLLNQFKKRLTRSTRVADL